MIKTATRRVSRLNTTTKLLIGLTLFFFIGKTLGHR